MAAPAALRLDRRLIGPAPILAIANSGCRVIAPDLRCHGCTGGPKAVEAYAIKSLVADVTALLDVAGEKQCVLVGHDFGAVLT